MNYELDSKNEGQVFTPQGIVITILDEVGYKGKKTLEKTIMEPSFGEGVFLIQIIERIINEAKKQGKTNEDICAILKNNVFGIEKDKVLYSTTINRLNALLQVYGIDKLDWSSNLINGDTLKEYINFLDKFDYVVGNPPYIRIHNIDEETRNIISKFKFSTGTTDMYIMFYEMSLDMLNNTGKIGFITPNSFMKNTSQRKFRDTLIKKKYISKIFDFKASKIFKEADVYTCICVLNKNTKRANTSIEYREYNMYEITKRNLFPIEYFEKELKSSAWNLSSEEDILFLEEIKSRPIKIGNIAIVQNGVATNRDEVYISRAWLDENQSKPYLGKHTDRNRTVYFNGYPIESKILHRCVKASKYDGYIDNTYIIFPYKPSNKIQFFVENKQLENNYVAIPESELKNKYPKAYQYLSNHWQSLSTRDMDKGVNWYQFGRSQGLQNSCYKKIVFKHIVNKDSDIIKPFIVDSDVIVYSGIYTTVDITNCIKHRESSKYDFNMELYQKELDEISEIISTKEFARYCKIVGKDMSGGYVGISTKHIKNFGTKLSSFPNFPVSIPKEDICIADNKYLNNLFNKEFLNCINESYYNMAKNGQSSSTRVEPFHSFLAKILQYKLGQNYEVRAKGYSYAKETKLDGNFHAKNLDISISKNGKYVGAIAFKLMTNNFKQNLGNFTEGLLGETAQMKGVGMAYAFCYLIPEVHLYLTNKNELKEIIKLTQNDLETYYNIANDESYKNRTPDSMFIGVHKVFKDEYLNALKSGDYIDKSDEYFLNSINPQWSNYEFVSDEDIQDYFIEHNNIGDFLDEFIEHIKS